MFQESSLKIFKVFFFLSQEVVMYGFYGFLPHYTGRVQNNLSTLSD